MEVRDGWSTYVQHKDYLDIPLLADEVGICNTYTESEAGLE